MPTQVPFAQVSPRVQAMPSSHLPPSGFGARLAYWQSAKAVQVEP
jgi:hypothetical protein